MTFEASFRSRVSKRQIGIVKAHIAKGIAEGARLIHGGSELPGPIATSSPPFLLMFATNIARETVR